MTLLDAIAIHKTYGEGGRVYQILSDVNLKIQRGEIVALEGRSGSGKTTLLSILGCILQPSSGVVMLQNQKVTPANAVEFRLRSIGFVFQQCNLISALSAEGAVSYVLRLKGWSAGKARNEARRLLELVGLGDRKDHLPAQLSGGERQRVAIARALAGCPALLLADEPTANLDSVTGAEILELVRDVTKSRDCALIVVTHDQAVRRIAERIHRLEDGRLRPVTSEAMAGA